MELFNYTLACSTLRKCKEKIKSEAFIIRVVVTVLLPITRTTILKISRD